jgi:hypothetical protein
MKRLILLVVVVSLMAAPTAFGASAVRGNYSGPGGVVSNLDPSTPKSTTVSHTSAVSDKGKLPFTGLDLVLLACGGIALVGVGMGVRRLSRPLA